MALKLDSTTGNISAGGDNTDGDLILNGNDGKRRIHLDAGSGNLYLGGNGADGDLVLMPSNAGSQSASASTIHLSADSGNIYAGGNGVDGDLVLKNNAGNDVVHIDGGNGNFIAGGDGADGDLILRGGSGADRIRMSADSGNLYIGGNGADGDIVVFAAGGDNKTLGQATIHINGDSGDIIMQNADFAEDFDIADTAGSEADAGAVMVLCDDGTLKACDSSYDRRVAGVVSGAGDYRPGIVMDKQHTDRDRRPIALVGKVYCKVDASYGAVRVGDLLTTSPTPGHAMAAKDRGLAFGATIGKALKPHADGCGLIPILVNLQ